MKNHKRNKKTPSTKKISLVQALYNALERPRHTYFKVANYGLALVTVVSVLAIVLETVTALAAYTHWFTVIEYVTVAIFASEYLVRLLATKQYRHYVFSFFGIIDLIAILPSFLGLTNLTFLKAARSVRFIRLLRMFRLAKVARFRDEKDGNRSVLGINFEIYAVTFVLTLLMLGSLFYVFEQHTHAANIPEGMYWALLAILGGVTYPQPETTAGTVVLLMARFTAMIVLGIMVGLVGTVLRLILIGAEKDVK